MGHPSCTVYLLAMALWKGNRICVEEVGIAISLPEVLGSWNVVKIN